jgi:hypothetical protein
MAKITFKAKVRSLIGAYDGCSAYVNVPMFDRSHCDMPAFRAHPTFGGIANSDLFPKALRRLRRELIGSDSREYFRLCNLPAGVTVDRSGFLAVVTVEV